jgi:hypothetical protein
MPCRDIEGFDGMRQVVRVLAMLALSAVALPPAQGASQSVAEVPAADRPTMADAQGLFYTARYEAAAALALALRSSQPGPSSADLATYELRTSALLFQLKALLGDQPDKKKTLARCEPCPEMLAAFLSDTTKGQALARERLQANPLDEDALFHLGKIDLNYVWLQLGPLGRRTGWDQYWEARKSLDAVLKRNPQHVRARVARAWIDYIVDTRMPRGTRWVLGGGSRKRALTAVREAAAAPADFFAHAEAEFALWEMQVRERNLTEATVVARRLARDFPENPRLVTFLDTHDRRLAR